MDAERIVTRIRALGVSTSQLSDANLYELIDHALAVYNRYRPKYMHSTFDTVAYQGAYTVDAGALNVVAVFWEPSDTSDVMSRVLAELKMMEAEFNYPSLLQIYYYNKHELRKTTNGRWTMQGNQVRLIPVPTTSGTVVPYIYTTAWEDVDDIPLADEELLIDGVNAMASAAVARARVGSGGWRAGDYQVEGGSASAEMTRASRSVLQWRSTLAGGAMGGRS